MDKLKLSGLKGTKQILETLSKKQGAWSEIQKQCAGISHRVFNTRLKQLETSGFVSSKAEMKAGKAVKIYSLSTKGKKLLELMTCIERL
ncbi:HxlR-like helix-turn-helix [archaeon BMS3Bbin16]|nr:HxlR-like helix-turn-helix [archaeon BMS3Bbin16]